MGDVRWEADALLVGLERDHEALQRQGGEWDRGLPAALLAVASAEKPSNETACRELGFGSSLLCSSCAKLGEYVGAEDALVTECNGCCTDDVSNSGTVYSKAVLDVCR